MKHLLSKLTLLGIVSLIFVSCSKSPEQYVENCADDRYLNYLTITIENHTNELEKLKKDWGTQITYKHKELEMKLDEFRYKISTFNKNSKLKIKLNKDDSYSNLFKYCSDELKDNEVYFKAKYK